jgi:hypothetical protein
MSVSVAASRGTMTTCTASALLTSATCAAMVTPAPSVAAYGRSACTSQTHHTVSPQLTLTSIYPFKYLPLQVFTPSSIYPFKYLPCLCMLLACLQPMHVAGVFAANACCWRVCSQCMLLACLQPMHVAGVFAANACCCRVCSQCMLLPCLQGSGRTLAASVTIVTACL